MSGWTRRQNALYATFVAAVVIGTGTLSRAIEADRPDVAFALLATGLAFAAGMGLLLVVRVLRER